MIFPDAVSIIRHHALIAGGRHKSTGHARAARMAAVQAAVDGEPCPVTSWPSCETTTIL